VIGHRGASALAPENTLAAFRIALALDVDGVEMDVRLSGDSEAVVIHDSRVDRTTDKTGPVTSFTSDELRRLDTGARFNRRMKARPRLRAAARLAAAHSVAHSVDAVTIPTLNDVLALLAPAGLSRIYVELKPNRNDGVTLLRVTLRAIQRLELTGTSTLLSFDHSLLRLAKQFEPSIRTAASFPASRLAVSTVGSIMRTVESIEAEEAALHFGLAGRRAIAALHEKGVSVSSWTANSPLVMRRLLENGVDAIITNYPDRLHRVLEKHFDTGQGPRGMLGGRSGRRSTTR
jgi:glycerophosphoryl diester phosphodiesterase